MSPPDTLVPNHARPVLELRVAITTDDYERLVRFYRAGLGLEPGPLWTTDQGRATILEMGRATLEIFDETQAATVDRIEVGKRVTGRVRFALRVPEVEQARDRLLAHGATLVHDVVVTPWGDRNARLQDPDGMQITLFQSPGP
jgi:lactoylglutathione lyase